MKLLILGAFDPEIDPLREWVKSRSDIALGTTGIGMVQAAASTAKLIAELEADRILFCGSIGSADAEGSIFSLISATKVLLADLALAAEEAYLPQNAAREYSADPDWLATIARLPQAPHLGAVHSALGISATESLVEALGEQTGASYENMELFGVAAACSLFHIPWSSLSCVTNTLSVDAHVQWKANHLQAAQLTAEAIRLLLDR